jgi:hypothetical protein
MNDDTRSLVLEAYANWFGPPSRILTAGRKPPGDVGAVVYLPSRDEQADPEANLTFLGTAGFGAMSICRGLRCEIGIEISGVLDDDAVEENAGALLDLASAPLETGRLFQVNQMLSNFAFPAFPRFDHAMLLDWDPIDGFRFPPPCQEIGLLRVLPLHLAEVRLVETYADRNEGYLYLFNQGLQEADPNRDSVV